MVYAQSHESIPTRNQLAARNIYTLVNVYGKISKQREHWYTVTQNDTQPTSQPDSQQTHTNTNTNTNANASAARRAVENKRSTKIDTQARFRNQQIHTIDLHCASRAYISHFTLFAHSTEAFKGCKFTVNTYISCSLRAVRSSRYLSFDWCYGLNRINFYLDTKLFRLPSRKTRTEKETFKPTNNNSSKKSFEIRFTIKRIDHVLYKRIM